MSVELYPQMLADTETLTKQLGERSAQKMSEWLQQKKDAERYRLLRRLCSSEEDWNIPALGSEFESAEGFDEAVEEFMVQK